MIGRPRCREWTPLTTQQLRLRSLIQIVGYNIRPPEWCRCQCSFYLTLHHTTMSAPFYTSERVSSPHPKWKEIESEITHHLSSTNVVIRIWCHLLQPNKMDDTDIPQDIIIQTWGVYFSGLRYIGANLALNFTSDCFKSNTLVFQMHGGYFCSYKSLKLEVIPSENEIEHSSLSSDSSGKTNQSKVTLESRFIKHQKLKESRSISPSKFARQYEREYSKSHSPVERGFRQNFPTMKQSHSLNIQSHRDSIRDNPEKEQKKDPNYIHEHHPDSLGVASDVNCDSLSTKASKEDLSASKIDLSETAENYDLRNESDGVPKFRYLALNFLKSEIRPSYNSSKLQKLHLLQYSIKKRQEAVQEIKERIYKKSALTNDYFQNTSSDDWLKLKTRCQKDLFSTDEENDKSKKDFGGNGRIIEEINKPVSNGPRVTLKLNDLLSFKSKPSPFQRSEHVRLTKQLEILRFKKIILSDERDSKLANIRRLKEIHAKLCEENGDLGMELLQSYHTLSRRAEVLKETRHSCAALRDLAARSHAALQAVRTELLSSLHQILHIQQKDVSTWTICDVPLPICGDENPRILNPVSDSVAAGFAAQATCLAAAFLNQPLRYKITLQGSASKILDITPQLPDPNIPLFARGGDVTLFRYAMFLLNKCIAQLVWGRGLPVHDMRPTLANLQTLLTAPNNLTDTSKLFGTYRWVSDSQCPRTQSLRSLVASERGKQNRQFNRFKDSVDGQSPESAMNLRRHRHSRSVGSYHDDQELPTLDASTVSLMGSEPNIYNTKLTRTEPQLKSHISDSEISRLSEEVSSNRLKDDKVVFTLGDDSTLNIEADRLIKMSINNDDDCTSCLDDNVKRICTEIEDFCSSDAESSVQPNYVEIQSVDNGSLESENLVETNYIRNKNLREELDIANHIDANESLDIAKYMERQSSCTNETEDADFCDSCEGNRDGLCDLACASNITDVIVIPSAEAILDTGQESEQDK